MFVPCWGCRGRVDHTVATCPYCGTANPFQSSTVWRHPSLISANFLMIAGPSSGGKTQLSRFLRFMLPGAAYLVRSTNRLPRDGEQEGGEYCYVDNNWFKRALENGSLVTHVGRNGNQYALTVEEVNRGLSHASTLLLTGNVDTALQLRAVYPNSRICFVAPDSIDELRAGIGSKGGTPEELASRLELLNAEMEKRPQFDFLFTRDSLTSGRIGYIDVVAPAIKSP